MKLEDAVQFIFHGGIPEKYLDIEKQGKFFISVNILLEAYLQQKEEIRALKKGNTELMQSRNKWKDRYEKLKRKH